MSSSPTRNRFPSPKRRSPAGRLAPTLLATLFLAAIASATPRAETASATGRIEGIVRYAPDPDRPWRFSRYYVKDARSGFLAEAIVALEGPGLPTTQTNRQPQTVTVNQVDFQFVPETVAVRVGDNIRFTNSDESVHNVMTSDGPKPFNVNMAKDGEYVHHVESAGGIQEPLRLGCVYHGGMRAWLFSFDHPWFQATSRDGRFAWSNVPTGRWTLRLIHPAGRLEWSQEVEVEAGGTNKLEISISPDNIRTTKR